MKSSFYNILEHMTGAMFNIIFIVLAIVAISFVGTRAYAFGADLFGRDLDVPFQQFYIYIPESEDVPNRADPLEVGRILQDAGLARNAWIFFLEARLNGSYNLFRPGTYSFNSHMTTNEIMEAMQFARVAPMPDIQITIPEGLTLREIGEVAEYMGLWTMEEWLYATDNYGPNFFFLHDVQGRPNPLEGYLFPDTYRLPQNPRPDDLIHRMLDRFQVKFNFEMEDRAAELGLTIDEVVIIASIIEKEVRVPRERYLVSAIIHNRLAQGMRLQMDSTVQYALDAPVSRMFFHHLEVDSPHNTYRVPGLPIGPISNPGEASLIAALNPADVNYLFMVVNDVAAGTHFFTNSYDEHRRARDAFIATFD